jgi:hypothetical protein
MRKSKRHGKNHTHNQIVVQSGVYTQFKGIDGKTWHPSYRAKVVYTLNKQ